MLSIFVVRDITARQEVLQATRSRRRSNGRSRVSTPVPTTVDGPGWYADPSGRYDHRYWDGTAWTEHVSRDGVADHRAGRARRLVPGPHRSVPLALLDRHEWTEHVSRDEELFLDPLHDDDPTQSDPGTSEPRPPGPQSPRGPRPPDEPASRGR